MTYLAISIGAVLGANARFLVGGWVAERLGASFPFGTFIINVTGSLLIGIVLTLSTERLTPDWFGLARHRVPRFVHHLLDVQLRDPRPRPERIARLRRLECNGQRRCGIHRRLRRHGPGSAGLMEE